MQEDSNGPNPVAERLRHYRISRGKTWQQVAETLGVSRGMLMMTLRGDRHLSAKALFRLQQAEKEAADGRSAAERIAEGMFGSRDVVPRVLGQKRAARVEVAVEYTVARSDRTLPTKVLLERPAERHCRKLSSLFGETGDTRLLALACLPTRLRSEGFLNQLSAESRMRLTKAALDLTIPDWRALVTGDM